MVIASAIRNNAGTNDEGFTTYYADGLLTPENLDEWLAQNEFSPREPRHYQFLGQFTKDLQIQHPDWSFPVIGGGGLADSVIMSLKGNFRSLCQMDSKRSQLY